MKKTRFVLSSIALGLSVLSTPFVVQADLPSFISEQNSLAPMLEKVQPAVVTLSVEGKTKVNSVSPFQDDIPEEFKFFFGDRFAEQFGGRGESKRNFRGLGSGVIINANGKNQCCACPNARKRCAVYFGINGSDFRWRISQFCDVR